MYSVSTVIVKKSLLREFTFENVTHYYYTGVNAPSRTVGKNCIFQLKFEIIYKSIHI